MKGRLLANVSNKETKLKFNLLFISKFRFEANANSLNGILSNINRNLKAPEY